MSWLDRAENWIDRMAGVLSPRWQTGRLAWRQQAAMMRNYDAASGIRPNDTWRGSNTSGELANANYREILRGNAQDMERNSDETNALLLAYVRNVVGKGPQLQAKMKGADGKLNAALNQATEDDWAIWCKKRNCDITGQQSFAGLLRMATRRRLVDGAAIFIKVYNGGGSFLPFTLQPKEVYDLDTTMVKYTDQGNLIVAGIELNSYNRPIAYWFKDVSVDGFYTGSSTRVEARRVLFWWERLRSSQIREITTLAPSLTRLRNVQEYLETVSVKERIAACFALAITKQLPMASTGRSATADSTSSYYPRTISPGMIMEMLPGDSVQAVTPPLNSAANAKEFANLQTHMIGAGQGLSFEVMSRDVSEVNYSSARFNSLQDTGSYEILFDDLREDILDETFEEFQISRYLAGRFEAPDFWKNRGNYFKHDFVAIGVPWVDPGKEVSANTEAINTGQDSLQNICAGRGLDWQEVADQNAEAEVYCEMKRKEMYEKAGMEYPGPKMMQAAKPAVEEPEPAKKPKAKKTGA